ncbi:MAG: hypothetical protein OIF54_10945 [Cohaesibacter sp.]|nr:hypothetical protein [Cohaesibacter sp.]
MKSAPFSFTIPMFIMMFSAVILGGLLGSALSSISIPSLLAGFLTAFLPIPVASFLRVVLGTAMARAAGVSGDAPFAFSWFTRYLIAAITGLIVAFFALSFVELNALSGAMIAVVTSSIVSIIMVVKVSM